LLIITILNPNPEQACNAKSTELLSTSEHFRALLISAHWVSTHMSKYLILEQAQTNDELDVFWSLLTLLGKEMRYKPLLLSNGQLVAWPMFPVLGLRLNSSEFVSGDSTKHTAFLNSVSGKS
jgi:hypothetical protein